MADTELQRTIRRSTAVLALLLSLFILLFQGYLAYRGLANDLRNIWPITRGVAAIISFGSGLYLLGSTGVSLYRNST